MAKRKQVYVIRVTLKGSKPPIWRKLAVPADIVLADLHEVIQIAMGWTNSHLHQFKQGNEYFVTKETPWGDPTDMEGEDEEAVTLGEVCPKVKSKLIYEYDFGDDWEHTIEVQKIIEPEPGVGYPICLGGRKACPPEDCGGIWGYYQLLETIAAPDADGNKDMVDWLGGDFDPDAFDLEEVNAILSKWRGSRSK